MVNHFDNNLVFTSKYGLARNLRTLIYSDNIDCYEFFPRCFDLADVQEFEDFIENFKATKVIFKIIGRIGIILSGKFLFYKKKKAES